MFNEKSAIVMIWVRAVKGGSKTLDEVPNLFNLREMVELVLNKEGEE
jgi:hypothetical protein